MKVLSKEKFKHEQLASQKTGEVYSLSALVSQQLSSEQLFIHHDVIAPGRRSSGPHHHSDIEEAVYVVKGTATVVEGETELSADEGSLILFDPKVAAPHFVINRTTQNVETMTFSKNSESDQVVYGGGKPYRSTFISHVELSVSEYAKSIRFYDKVLVPLGWKRLVCQKSHTTFSDGAMKIVLCPTEEKYLKDGFHRKRTGLNHLAFYAPSKESVDQLYQNVLLPNQIECLYEKAPTGDPDYYAVFFEDPDRIKIEVVYSPRYCDGDHWTNQIQDDFDPYA